jgi:hypothetical protein
MRRRTYVIRVHGDEISTLEDVRTGERVALRELDEIPRQLARWLRDERQSDRRRIPQVDGEVSSLGTAVSVQGARGNRVSGEEPR